MNLCRFGLALLQSRPGYDANIGDAVVGESGEDRLWHARVAGDEVALLPERGGGEDFQHSRRQSSGILECNPAKPGGEGIREHETLTLSEKEGMERTVLIAEHSRMIDQSAPEFDTFSSNELFDDREWKVWVGCQGKTDGVCWFLRQHAQGFNGSTLMSCNGCSYEDIAMLSQVG